MDAMMIQQPSDSQPMARHEWSPYQDNKGSCLAVGGDGYVVACADTRTSVGYSIHTRNFSKMSKLTDKVAIVSAGQQSEIITLHKNMKRIVADYIHKHRQAPTVAAVAQRLSTILYGRRFFPYYTFNLVVGLDENNKGAVYGYDAIGSMDRLTYGAQGSGQQLIQSVLDNQLQQANQIHKSTLQKEDVLNLVKDVMTSTAERDIYTGDRAEVLVIDASGFHMTTLELRKD